MFIAAKRIDVLGEASGLCLVVVVTYLLPPGDNPLAAK
jgi:hypothetical protein